jgi:hypothetical protein
VEVEELVNKGDEYSFKVKRNEDGVAVGHKVKAVAGDSYIFKGWDGDAEADTARSDEIGEDDDSFAATAKFARIYTVKYQAGVGGSIAYVGAAGDTIPVEGGEYEFQGEEGAEGPVVIAVPDEGFRFVQWNDASDNSSRSDTIASDTLFAAAFVEEIDVVGDVYTLIYFAGIGGSLKVGDELHSSVFTKPVEEGGDGPEVTAVADNGFVFVSWSDGKTEAARIDADVRHDTTVHAIFVPVQVSVAYSGRDIPQQARENNQIAAVAPVKVKAGEFSVGPSPVSKRAGTPVGFFWTGGGVKGGKLIVYDAKGSAVKTVPAGGRNAGRDVGAWDLTDKRGNPVAEGTYLVKGYLSTADGKKEKVSALISVVK